MFYYKCENCQSEWNGIKVLPTCPFCDTKVSVQTSNFTKIDDALLYIFNVYGIETINESNRLVALLSDYAPTLERERKLIRVALNVGVYSDLMSIDKNDKSEQELAINKAVTKLHNDAFMDPVIAKETIEWFIKQLDWNNESFRNERGTFVPTAQTTTVDTTQHLCENTYISSSKYDVGDIVEFGKYPFEANGQIRPIRWRIMDKKGDRLLLWSEYCVDTYQFDGNILYHSWEYSSLRLWLRDKFMKTAFTADEIKSINFTKLEYAFSPINNKLYSSQTEDKIFIPSYEDLKKYNLNNDDLMIKATPYATICGAYCNENDNTFWWLRNPGIEKYTQMLVSATGEINISGSYVYLCNRGVRPALWVDLNKIKWK